MSVPSASAEPSRLARSRESWGGGSQRPCRGAPVRRPRFKERTRGAHRDRADRSPREGAHRRRPRRDQGRTETPARGSRHRRCRRGSRRGGRDRQRAGASP
ncbi:hypothetical protein ACFPRL_04175 [Pseudoclavibacter helvolus]